MARAHGLCTASVQTENDASSTGSQQEGRSAAWIRSHLVNPEICPSRTELRLQRLQQQLHGSSIREGGWLEHGKGAQQILQQWERYINQLQVLELGHRWGYWLCEVIAPISDNCTVQMKRPLRVESRLKFMYILSQSLTINSTLAKILVASTGTTTKCICLPYLLSKHECSSNHCYNVLSRSDLPDSALTSKMLSWVLFCRKLPL